MALAAGLPAMFRVRVLRFFVASVLWFALAVWAGVILWLSSLGAEQLPDAAFLAWDKLNHFLAFAAGGWLAAAALGASRRGSRVRTRVVFAVLLVASFGAVDEMSQLLSPGRSGGDLYDWIADLIGAIAGALLACFTHALLRIFIPRR